MFLSGDILLQRGAELVDPFDPEGVDGAAYTLRLGGEAYVSPDGPKVRRSRVVPLKREQELKIPAGQFAFLLTRETIRVPYNVLAFINMKNGLKSMGLINVSGFHVDPGYDGKLVFAVFNAGPKTVSIRQNDEAFLIWFAELKDATRAHARSKPGYTKIESDLIARIPDESASLNSLSGRIERLERKLSWRRGALIYLAGIVSAAAAAVIGGWALELF